jgi:hypothetical protein
MRVLIFRKDAEGVTYPKSASKAVTDNILSALAVLVRVKRPATVEHFLPTSRGRSPFARQTAITRADLHYIANCEREGVVTDRYREVLACGWEVPAEDLGRAPKNGGERDWSSTAQSILLYAKDRVGVTSLAEGDLFTVSPDGLDISVAVVS